MSQRKIWPLRCSDEVWRQCVEALASDADVILVDVSDISDHVRWELAFCRDRELLDRVVPLVSQERLSAVEREFAHGLDGIRLPKPYVYGPKSLVDVSGFVDEVAGIVARGWANRALLQEPSLGGAVLAWTFGWVVLALAGQLFLGLLLDRGSAGVVLATFAASIAPLLVCSYLAVTGGRLLPRDGSARRRTLVGTAGGALVVALEPIVLASLGRVSIAAVLFVAIAVFGATSAVVLVLEARFTNESAAAA